MLGRGDTLRGGAGEVARGISLPRVPGRDGEPDAYPEESGLAAGGLNMFCV